MIAEGGGPVAWVYFTASRTNHRHAKRWDFSMPSSGLPRVRFLCGITEVIRTDRWTVQVTGGQYLSRQQLPLQLAWAISIHKSQVTIRCRGGQAMLSPGWPQIHYAAVEDVGLDLPTSISWKLLFQVCNTKPGLGGWACTHAPSQATPPALDSSPVYFLLHIPLSLSRPSSAISRPGPEQVNNQTIVDTAGNS